MKKTSDLENIFTVVQNLNIKMIAVMLNPQHIAINVKSPEIRNTKPKKKRWLFLPSTDFLAQNFENSSL